MRVSTDNKDDFETPEYRAWAGGKVAQLQRERMGLEKAIEEASEVLGLARAALVLWDDEHGGE